MDVFLVSLAHDETEMELSGEISVFLIHNLLKTFLPPQERPAPSEFRIDSIDEIWNEVSEIRWKLHRHVIAHFGALLQSLMQMKVS